MPDDKIPDAPFLTPEAVEDALTARHQQIFEALEAAGVDPLRYTFGVDEFLNTTLTLNVTDPGDEEHTFTRAYLDYRRLQSLQSGQLVLLRMRDDGRILTVAIAK